MPLLRGKLLGPLSGPLTSLCAVLVAWPAAGHSQSTAPSSITPPTLRPAPQTPDTAPAIPQSERLVAPEGAEGLSVTLDAIAIEGGYPELSPGLGEESAQITTPLLHRPVTLAQLYAMASEVEAAYARRGFVLARVTVPPQHLASGGAFRIVVIDGFIERVDVSAVPARVRAQVANRAARLVGRRHLRLEEIEQPLLLAGDVPGLALTSTLTRGSQPGAARLLLSGRHALVSGSVSAENNLAASLGRYQVVAQVSLNSVLGLGEQVYGFAVSGYDLPRAFRSDSPVRVLGGGVILAPGSGRLSINPEVTFSRTQPAPSPGVPVTRGSLRRLSLRGGFVVQKTRRRTIAVNATVEQVEEANDAVDFGTRLSLDRFIAARVGLSYSAALPGGGVSASAQVSQGLGGLGGLRVGDLPAGVLPSRDGAAPDFTKASLSLRLAEALGHGLQLGLSATGQTSFDKPVFRSEQTALEGNDALSAYIGGATAVDSALVGRAELSRALAFERLPLAIRLSPYAFTAAGRGWIARPSAGNFAAYNLGAGMRGALARTGLGFTVEYAHGFSRDIRFDRVDRVAFSTTLRF